MNITIEKMVPHAVMLNVVNKNGIKLKVVYNKMDFQVNLQYIGHNLHFL